MRKSLIAFGFAYLWASQGAVAQNVPGKSCYYPASKGYWAPKLAVQRKRTKECLIRISYEIAARGSPYVDAGLSAADYCQQAYTYEEEKVAAKEGRPLNLDVARTRAAAFARPWIQQALKLKCLPPSAR
ncbi:hypothetical protein GCM10011395_26470 [Sphingomonas psychrolutea]|uniref:Uncharacterized protein n=1 Tax=Sphingomonas psychrolutea TaxID=1259676 RepID=A0ABQ1H1M3_9SPHN|nr:hypothetical protein GCM10011395_26470 [Sphingomonas psychrolutea]